MPKTNSAYNKFNRGLVSALALGRVDLEQMPWYAEEMTNWMPRVLGSMMLRPGTGYIDSTYNNSKAFHIPFIFANDDTAILELTGSIMRVRVNESIISRTAVSSAITNGTFTSNITSWNDISDSGCTAAWDTSGAASLTGTLFGRARLRQQVSVLPADKSVEHATRVVVTKGKLIYRVGSTAGGDEYINEAVLGVGTHSLAFTPTGDFYISIEADRKYSTLVDSVSVESSGDMTLPTPWVEADLSKIRCDQSADIVYVGAKGYQQMKIERRATRSWSIVKYRPEDGPFKLINTTQTTITPSATGGDVTLTASKPLFKATDVGALVRIDSVGQLVNVSVTAEAQWSNPVKVTGVDTARDISVVRSGVWVATVTLQRSVGDIGNWVDVTTYTTDATVTYNDTFDNQIMYYRIGVDTGDFTSGTATLSLSVASGSITGVARVTAISTSQAVSAEVMQDMGNTSASPNWYGGAWSDKNGYPMAVCLYDGRIVWAGKDKIYASVSDAYESFDDQIIGDSGPISRSIGQGPVDTVNWLLPMYRLVLGGQADEWEIRSSALDEPITPTNFNTKSASNQGSASVPAEKIDGTGVFVQKSGKRIYELGYSQDQFNNYQTDDLTKLNPDLAGTGGSFTKISVQRQPDTRIHAMRSDGDVAINIRDHAETIKCWILFETDGVVEDTFVMPGDEEDKVYYCVKRTVNGQTVRYLERWALESECQGGTINKQADCFVTGTQVASTSISVPHLEGEEVVVWADGKDYSPLDSDGEPTTYTVTGGVITLGTAVSSYVVGKYYEATFKSSKLALAAGGGTALNQRKRVNEIGVILHNTHYLGLQYGPDFDTLDDLPLVEQEQTTSADYIWPEYDMDLFEFAGDWDVDSRLCLKASSPRPCTVLCAVVQITTHDRG